jgi:membrane protease YdiL (CAAX protease family)
LRVEPSARTGFVAVGLYLAVLLVGVLISGVNYDEIGDSTSNLVGAVLVPVGIGALVLAGLTSWLGWWGPALREAPCGPRWFLLLPVAVLLIPVLNLLTEDIPDRGAQFFLILGLAMLLVGFSEELLTRGLLLTGLRSSVTEVQVWLFTSLTFGLIHGINLVFGQDLGSTLIQVASATTLGSTFYAIRRVTGFLPVCMLLHAFWDFSIFAALGEGGATSTGSVGIGSLFLWPVAIFGLFITYRLLRDSQGERPQTP